LNTPQEGKWWEFRHDSFQKGKPQLLSNIMRRSNVNSVTENHPVRVNKDVRELRAEVDKLRASQSLQTSELSALRQQVQQLQILLNLIYQQQYTASAATAANGGAMPTLPAIPPHLNPLGVARPLDVISTSASADENAAKRRKVSESTEREKASNSGSGSSVSPKESHAAELILQMSSTGANNATMSEPTYAAASLYGGDPRAVSEGHNPAAGMIRAQNSFMRMDSMGEFMTKLPSLGPLASFDGKDLTRVNSLYDPSLLNQGNGGRK